MSKIAKSRRFSRTVSYSLPLSRYRETRTGRQIELVLPGSGVTRRNPADRRG